MTYLQAREGDGPWVDLKESDYFVMAPYGYRTRLTRYQEIFQNPKSPAHRELAQWVKQRHDELYPDAGELTEFRIVVGKYLVRKNPEEGIWKKPPSTLIPLHLQYTLFRHRFTGAASADESKN